MNSNEKLDGLSARRKTILESKQLEPAKPLVVIILLLSVLLGSCHEKTSGQQSSGKHPKSALADSTAKPQVNVKVNKRYDDKGNLVGFDSLYSSYYSNIKGDSVQMDSLMRGFDTYFQRNHPMFFNNRLNTLFFNDSLRYPDFFHDDFFMKHYQLNDLYMKDMMRRMDSIKNKFYKDQHHRNSKDPRPKTGT